MIYTLLNRPHRKPTPSGSRYINTYTETIVNGHLELEKSGRTNVYELIQADAEECKIERILQRVAMGDLNALNQREATYFDATTMPKNFMELQNLSIRMKDEFAKMPLEVRRLFNNSAEEYINEMGTNEFLEKMAPYNEKIMKISKEKNDKEYRAKVAEGAKLNYDIEKEMNSIKAKEGAKTNE